MNCKDFEGMIQEIAGPRAADKAKQLDALEHAGRCLWCALRLDEETRLTESLQGFAKTLHEQRAPAHVEEGLVQAFRKRTSRATAPGFALTGKRLWQRLSWGLIFAATLAAAGIVILHTPRLHPRSSTLPPQVANHQPLVSSEASRAKEAQPLAPGQSEEQVKGQREVTTDFIPLASCDDPECLDEAMLVRVMLPPEALLMYGLPIDDAYGTEEPVEADVVLGSDGVPFAIRFVD